MRDLTRFCVVTLWVWGAAVTGCSSNNDDATQTTSGTTSTYDDALGGRTNSGGTGGTSNGTAVTGVGNTANSSFNGSGGALNGSVATGLGGAGHSRSRTVGGTSSTAPLPQSGGSGGATGVNVVRSAEVALLSTLNPMNTRAVAAAAFSTSPAKPCSTQSFGDCTLTTVCSDPEAIDYVSAGTVTVTMSAGGITLTPDSRNIYESMRLPSYLGGTEQVNISAAGSTIPAFSADLTVPLVLLIESPKPDANGIVQARMSEDLVIQFSRGTTGVELYVGFGDGTFVCRSAAGASSMTITKDALAMLGSYATFSLWTRYRQEVAAGDFTVTTSVYMDAMSPDKKNPVVVEVQ